MTTISKILSISVTPVIDATPATPYASGDALSSLLKFKSVNLSRDNTAFLQSITVVDLESNNPALDFIVFSSLPAGSFTKNVAADIGDADMTKIVAMARVVNWKTFADNSIGISELVALPIKTTDGAFYILPIVRGTPQYADASNIVITVNLLQEE